MRFSLLTPITIILKETEAQFKYISISDLGQLIPTQNLNATRTFYSIHNKREPCILIT